MPRKLLLVDGNNLVRRMDSVPAFQRLSYKGQPTGAIHASVDNLLTTIDTVQPDEVAVVFDGIGAKEKKASTHYAGYKAHRGSMADTTAGQMNATRDILRAAGVFVFQQPTVDADDVIGTLSRIHLTLKQEPTRSVMIYSNDKDFFQLVNDYTCVMRPKYEFWYTPQVCAEFGVAHPRYVADYLAIVGDSVDGIPGLPGVGPKTAKEWLQQHKCVDDLIDGYEGPKRALIDENSDLLQSFLKLTRIRRMMFTAAQMAQIVPKLTPGPCSDRLLPLLRQHGLFKLEQRLRSARTVLTRKSDMFG